MTSSERALLLAVAKGVRLLLMWAAKMEWLKEVELSDLEEAYFVVEAHETEVRSGEE